MSALLTVRSLTDATRKKLPTGNTLARELTRISNSVAAGALLDSYLPQPGAIDLDTGTAGPRADAVDAGAIITLPQFARVTHGDSGQINLITWSCEASTVIVPDGEEREMSWRVDDSSHATLSGVLTIRGDGTIAGGLPPLAPSMKPSTETFGTVREAKLILRRILETGEAAAFQLTHSLTRFVNDAVDAASLRVYSELNDKPQTSRARHVLDESEREKVTDQILYGVDTDGEASVTLRLLRRVATTAVTKRKSVVGVIAVNLWSSAAETHVRRFIGDPHVGRIIRRISRDLKTDDPEVVQAHYKSKYPDKALGIDRVTSALSAGATIHADSFTLRDDEPQP